MSLIVLFLLFAGMVYPWSGPSHVIIYMIARKEIGPNQTALVDEIIKQMPEPEANYPNPYEIAIWADDMKMRYKFKALGGFHYYDQLFCDGIDPSDVTEIVDPVYNVVNAVLISQKTMKYRPPYPFHFDGRFEKSFALRFLIHTVGDLHQPLHTATRCTPSMPKCDGGGNRFRIKGHLFTRNLHALWDQAMGFIEFKKRPYNEQSIEYYQGLADAITKQFPRASLSDDLAITDQWAIAKKGLDIAINYAYKGIHENEYPSEEYKRSRFEICKRQIALAGYRLADMLKEIVYSAEDKE
eukprot:TRINITY_DN121_c0_g1_i1.p1 TRINITY_DN121_c0_g1~~TRINITY_DN121_c0_g1_i1.p1  ORF type:complete len:297 (-),score=82.71 TRINITY_DN121_c0_g1_i1:115-1005(-)